MRLSLDWMNLFGGLTASQITSVIVVAVIFTIASGLVLLSLIVFGVRAGLMVRDTRSLPWAKKSSATASGSTSSSAAR